ncbi:MAG: isopentenyl-diphosphate Delta-isomerase [Pseudodonghicola sp.]|nr:isopentenyl-diphosphate Delta-isomerase [Pseudodonghicola sp.]
MSLKIPAWVDGALIPVDKLEVHQKGLRHKAVSVFVLRGDEILLQRRALGKYHTPGLWANTCCTHPLWEEDPATCALRRLAQELGITGLVPEYRHRLEYRADVGGGLIEHELVDVFVAHVHGALALRPDPDEVMQTRWIGADALRVEIAQHPERFTPWLKIYLDQHRDDIFGPDPDAGPDIDTGDGDPG